MGAITLLPEFVLTTASVMRDFVPCSEYDAWSGSMAIPPSYRSVSDSIARVDCFLAQLSVAQSALVAVFT